MAANSWNAKLYNDKHAFVWQSAKGLLDLLAPQAGESILDLGCGTGHLTAEIAATGARVVGIDRSAEMISEAKAKYPAIDFQVVDATQLRFDQNSTQCSQTPRSTGSSMPRKSSSGLRAP